MKDIPALFLMLAVFIVGSVFLLFYAKSGPEVVAQHQAIWPKIAEIKSEIKDRKIKLDVGQREKKTFPPFFEATLLRQPDYVQGDDTYARYMVHMEVMGLIPKQFTFAPKGFELGLVDRNPTGYMGDVVITAFLKQGMQP